MQKLLGHRNIETTMTSRHHVVRDIATVSKSPLELMLEGSSESIESGDV
ncbi:MAG: hypothetical protein JW884_13580 [Deltaproteobacteria bacterium]|nr:hypothetical protein [Deltaproteobacteria bacterium]